MKTLECLECYVFFKTSLKYFKEKQCFTPFSLKIAAALIEVDIDVNFLSLPIYDHTKILLLCYI